MFKKILKKGKKGKKERKGDFIMKKVISLILSMAMVLSLTVLSFADTTYTITMSDAEAEHVYEVYQIFTGDLSGSTLSNIVWGSGVSEDGKAALGDAADKAETLTTASAAEKFADTLVSNDYLADYVGTLTSERNTLNVSKAGYYLIKDRAISDNSATYILQVVDDVTVKPKKGTVTVEKKVKDINDSTDDALSEWQDSADHDINDLVPFQLTATLPGNVTSYDTYKVIFHDTLSKGLTYEDDTNEMTIKIDGKEVTGFTVNPVVNDDGITSLTISCNNVKALGATNNSVITVEYKARLNENAVIGSTGNPNTVYLEYSNNPDASGSGDNHPTGQTPEDTVIVFTYKTVINKVRPEGNKTVPLTGAEFTLEKYNKETDKWEAIKVVKNEKGTTFTFNGLDDGQYRLTESTTPAGYNTIDPIVFTVTAKHDILSDNPALTSLSGNAAKGEITFTSSTDEGSLSANVINNAGTTLPETGGIGTTIFYVVGAVLVIGAGVLFITKRRMSTR